MKYSIAVVLMLTFATVASCEPVAHKFELWGSLKKEHKLTFYWGWLNGLMTTEKALPLVYCLDSMSYAQGIAMIDKHFDTHPEKWSDFLSAQFLEALTVRGGACEGKNPLASGQNR